MPATIRSGASAFNDTQRSRGAEISSDESDEGIPAIKTPTKLKPKNPPSLRLPASARPTKRPREDDHLSITHASKRRMTNDARGTLAPAFPSRDRIAIYPSPMSHPAAGDASRRGSTANSRDESVDPHLLSKLNNMLSDRPQGESNTPSKQIHREAVSMADVDSISNFAGLEQSELRDIDLSVEPKNPHEEGTISEEQESGLFVPDESSSAHKDANNSNQLDGAADHDEDGESEVRVMQRSDSSDDEFQDAADHVELDNHDDVDRQSDDEAEVEEHDKDQDAESEVGFDIPPDMDQNDFEAGLCAKELFLRDVQNLGGRHVTYEHDSLLFDVPFMEQSTCIHLEPKDFRKIHRLMNRKGWAGGRGDWEEKLLERHVTLTSVGPLFRYYLLRLERLFIVTPKAPSLAEQNRFLNEHSDLWAYYVCMIKTCVDSVLKERLPFPKQVNSFAFDEERRKRMVEDLAQVIIPLFIRVLAKAWKLGGTSIREFSDSSFTSTTIHHVARLLGWIRKLYGRLSRELKRKPLRSREKAEFIEQLKTPLDAMHDMLDRAPDDLQEEERRIERNEERRRWNLEMQEHKKVQLAIQEEQKKNEIKEHNARVARSIRGLPPIPRRDKGSIPELARQKTRGSHTKPQQQFSSSSRQQSSRSDREWRQEEENELWNMMNENDLNPLPDLGLTSFKLNRSKRQIVRKAKEILHTIATYRYQNEVDKAGIEEYIEETMSQWMI